MPGPTRMRSPWSAAVALAVLVALIAAGCGGSGGASTTATTATTPSESTSAVEGHDLERLPRAPGPAGSAPSQASTSAEAQRAYLRAVFDDAQRMWEREFAAAGLPFRPAHLVLFSQAVQSGCGAQANVGPFYCGADHGIYLDLRFFELLVRRFGIGGFAQAYIIGHEFGHHLQNLLGIQHRVIVADQHDPAHRNARSVRVELQADCLAGVWAHSVYERGALTDADLEHALKAASVVGDDFQMRMAGHIVDSSLWTHGSSAQRRRWLKTGFETGDPSACDTFSAATL